MEINERPALSVAVVGICSAAHLARCLEAVGKQEGVAPFETVVAYDPQLAGIEELAEAFPTVRFVCNQGQRTPLELASRALRESDGEIILLTEDHCVPHPDWAAKLSASLVEGRAAAGGVVELSRDASPVDWAFYFVDFFRYADPVVEGASPTLTVCNVAYRRDDLERIRLKVPWKVFFHETAVNSALRSQFGELFLSGAGRVTMRRHVRLRDAVRERYVFGRLFGCTRLENCEPRMKVVYKLLAPLLPIVLLSRMLAKALRAPEMRGYLAHGIGPLALLVFAWSWGEWLGYLTEQRPADLRVAREVEVR